MNARSLLATLRRLTPTPGLSVFRSCAVAAAARGKWLGRVGFRVALLQVLATGCSGSTHQLQVVPSGHGTFIVPSQDLMGASSNSTEKMKAYETAAVYCKKRGGEIETISTSANEGGFQEIAAPEIEFRCVTPGAR